VVLVSLEGLEVLPISAVVATASFRRQLSVAGHSHFLGEASIYESVRIRLRMLKGDGEAENAEQLLSRSQSHSTRRQSTFPITKYGIALPPAARLQGITRMPEPMHQIEQENLHCFITLLANETSVLTPSPHLISTRATCLRPFPIK